MATNYAVDGVITLLPAAEITVPRNGSHLSQIIGAGFFQLEDSLAVDALYEEVLLGSRSLGQWPVRTLPLLWILLRLTAAP